MSTLRRLLAGALMPSIAVAALVVGAPPSVAAPDLSGRWVSDSLRDNRIGYFLVLRSTTGSATKYTGHLRFERQDGSRERRIPVMATVSGDAVVITARDGGFDRGGRTLRARLDARGVMTLDNCLDRLSLVMSWDLDSDCTLRRPR